MIAGIASIVFIPLLAVCFAHAMWALGMTWPVHDEQSLARTVVGFKGITKMPPRWASALVAIATFAAGVIALLLSDPETNLLLALIGLALAAVFLLRGALGFTAGWRAKTPEEPFATFDRKLYSPLCLGLGLGFIFLSIWNLT